MDFADEACSLSEVRRRRTLSHRAAAEASVASHNVDDARTSNANDDHKQHKAAATKMPKTSKRECALASLRSRLRSFCAPPLCAPCFGYGRSLWAVPFTSGEDTARAGSRESWTYTVKRGITQHHTHTQLGRAGSLRCKREPRQTSWCAEAAVHQDPDCRDSATAQRLHTLRLGEAWVRLN